MVSTDIDLSVIVPAYNEAERISKTLERLQEYLGGNSSSYEILVVLDGPTDNTRDVVQALSGRIENLRIVDRQVNRGKGFTVKEGMLKAAGRLRLFTDADNSTDIAHFEKMKVLFDQGYDLAIASRDSKDVRDAQQSVSQPWYKRLIGHVGNLVVQLLVVRGIWDTQCGFKAFRAEVAERIFSQTVIEGWGFDIEVLALARAFDCKIGIVPAHWVNDDRSHVRSFDYLRVLADTLRIRSNFTAGKYQL
jgi:glycosyltransferase involved in cell wall biosynthesis